MEKKKKERKRDGLEDAALGLASDEVVGRYGSAAAEYLKGYKGVFDENGQLVSKGLKQIADSKVHPDFQYQNLKQQAGFAAENHYVSKENADRIIQGDSLRYSRSNDVGFGNDPVIDILAVDVNGNPIIQNGEPLWSAQMKFCGKYDTPEQIKESSEKIAKELAGDKWERYRGHKVLVPSEQYEHVRQFADEEAQKLYQKADQLRKNGEVEKARILEQKAEAFEQVSKDVTDSGISSEEAMFLREYPKLATAKYVMETAHQAGWEQAKAGAIMSGTISTSINIVSMLRGEKEIKEALRDIALDTAKGSATSYIITAGGTAIKGFMQTSGNSALVNLSKTNMPAMIATVTVQVGKSLIRYAKGEITGLELAQELGEKGTGMLAASWGAAIGTAIFPGVGTVIGGMIGYMTTSSVYKAAMQVLQEEKMSKERREKIHAFVHTAREAMRKQQIELNEMIERFYKHRKAVFDAGFHLINQSMEHDDLDQFTEGIHCIALEMGASLQFKNFEEFDTFMMDPYSALEF